jgi:putative membrane protein
MASSAVDIDVGTRLAIDRTRLAYERTLMAWVRTAVSMITFGFTIYKYFEFELKDRPMPSSSVLSPHEFGLLMITIGLVALLLSTVQHRQSRRALRTDYGQTLPPSVAAIVAGLFAVLGLLALATVVLRW